MKKEPSVAANAANAQAKASDVATHAGVAAVLAPCEAVIEYRSPADLAPNPRNPRTHSEKQVQLLAAAIKEFGVFVPVVVDEKDVILAGHARVAAAKLLGLSQVPTIRVQHLTPERKRAFVLADNRLAEMAGWDEELLGAELGELSGLELDFEFEITGFDTVDIDRLEALTAEQAVDQEVVPELDRNEPTVSAVGDLWQLGHHRLFCGSALEDESYRRLLGDERVQLVFSDPPYNVPIDGHVCGSGSVKHGEFKMASGEMSDEEFVAFLEGYMRLAAAHSADGAIHFHCMDWRHMGQMLEAARPIYGPPKNLCVWIKTNAGMGIRAGLELIRE